MPASCSEMVWKKAIQSLRLAPSLRPSAEWKGFWVGLMRPKAEALGYLEAWPARLSCRGEHPDLQVRETPPHRAEKRPSGTPYRGPALPALSTWEGLKFVTPLIRKERV